MIRIASARAVATGLEQTLPEERVEVEEDLLRVDLVVAWMEGTGRIPHQHVQHVLNVVLQQSHRVTVAIT